MVRLPTVYAYLVMKLHASDQLLDRFPYEIYFPTPYYFFGNHSTTPKKGLLILPQPLFLRRIGYW